MIDKIKYQPKDKTIKDKNVLSGLDKIILYHGSVLANMDSILKEGILPWNMSNGHNWHMDEDFFGFFIPKMDHVYFAYHEEAKQYAFFLKNKYNDAGIIIEAELDTAKLADDEDSYQSDWIDSLLKNGCCSHKGYIDPDKILNIYNLEGDILYSR